MPGREHFCLDNKNLAKLLIGRILLCQALMTLIIGHTVCKACELCVWLGDK